MKFQSLIAISALAVLTAEAAAQTTGTKVASASTAVTAAHPAAAPKPQFPPARAAIDPSPSADAKPKQRPVRRAAPRPQQPPQPLTWQERMRTMWGIDNAADAPAQTARPAQPQYPQAPGYTARPNSRLLFGRFYTKTPRQTVAFPGNHAPGTIIVRHSERRLYYVLGNGQAIRYAVAVGREGASWSGTSKVSNKREWPSWTPTPNILKRQPNLPRHMEGGPQNPMGARALYLGDTLYRIHGTNEPWTIGEEVSSGCIRMTNEDVVDLYNRTRLGATVIVTR